MDWHKKYIEAILDALRPHGDVLQIGFGDGEAAEQIQRFLPSSHVIIERNSEKAGRAEKWGKNRTSVKIIANSWESALPSLAVFDSVFYNELDPQIQPAVKDSLMTSEVLKEGERLLQEIGEQLPDLKRIRYQDHELDEFCQNIPPSSKSQISRFLADLEENGQITTEQKEKMIRKHKLPELKKSAKRLMHLEMVLDPALLFLKECLRTHMRKGSRVSYYAPASVSKTEDPLFNDEIVLNPAFHFREEVFKFKEKEGLIVVIEQLA